MRFLRGGIFLVNREGFLMSQDLQKEEDSGRVYILQERRAIT